MSRAYEEYFSQEEAMTPAEEKLTSFLWGRYSHYSELNDHGQDELDINLQELLDDLEEEFYLAGKMYQKEEDKRKMEDIVEDAVGTCSYFAEYECMASVCDRCDDYYKSHNDLVNGIKKYFGE